MLNNTKLEYFKLSWQLSCNVAPVSEWWNSVNVGCIANVSDILTDPFFRMKWQPTGYWPGEMGTVSASGSHWHVGLKVGPQKSWIGG